MFVQIAEEMAVVSFPDKIISRVEGDNLHTREIQKNNAKTFNGTQRRLGERGWRPYKGPSYRPQGQTGGWYHKRYCMLHREGDHSTGFCKEFSEVLNRERNRVRREVSRVEINNEVKVKNEESENKEFLYYFVRVETEGNPFMVSGFINGRRRQVLDALHPANAQTNKESNQD
ncbi:hypothetical protein NGRA_2143 [Nosema granulosis]|uniref:Uncharacterized protein n=1 Tax=Nosema granulosis TaxID=83296 RepID=A0A9P6GXJ9_9MICR|nr:hypothetical protein NGRA_2143 [Nosema granulosis]